jgi:glutaredoxin
MKRARLAAAIFVTLAAGSVLAQQLYRWTDEKGRVHITDTPPPANAKNVQKKKPATSAAEPAQQPFELAQALKEFPVTLYTSPGCQELCARARAALNKRGVPFKEVQVWDEASNEELKRISGANDVPTLVVGRSVHKGFEQEPYDALLDSARYPKAGTLRARAQAAPPVPEDYVPPEQREARARAEPVKPEVEEAKPPSGPYSPTPPRPSPKK